MSNEMKDFTIKLRCNEAFYRALVLMLRYASKLGSWGSSRLIAIYFDGDGMDRVSDLDVSEPIPESDKGQLKGDRPLRKWFEGDFLLDTDDVFSGVEG